MKTMYAFSFFFFSHSPNKLVDFCHSSNITHFHAVNVLKDYPPGYKTGKPLDFQKLRAQTLRFRLRAHPVQIRSQVHRLRGNLCSVYV
jgi:hypothetical protein